MPLLTDFSPSDSQVLPLKIDQLEKSHNQEMFFLNETIFAVQEKRNSESHQISSKSFVFFRTVDCSKICVLDMKDFELLQNTTATLCKNKHAVGLLDKTTNKIYPCEILTLLHLGATNA